MKSKLDNRIALRIALKTCWILNHLETASLIPTNGTTLQISSSTLTYYKITNCTTATSITAKPHSIEAVDTDHPEGIYLPEYQHLPKEEIPTQPYRTQWYRDLTSALCHIHSFGIAHADVRIENARAVLPFVNLALLALLVCQIAFLRPSLCINGPSLTQSNVMDIFAR